MLYIANHSPQAKLVSDEVKEASIQILSASAEGRKRLRQLDSRLYRAFIPLMEWLIIPGITLHYVLRKRFIEHVVLESIKDGATQVINLGAGFDTAAYRLSRRFPQVNFVEVDHPATHAVKRDALAESTGERQNLHFIPVDFTTQRLEDVLDSSPVVSPDARTVVIVEGVLMYLEEPQVEHLFRSLPKFLHAGKRVVFTAIRPASPGTRLYGPLMNIYLKFKEEPLNWLCKKSDLPAFLKAVEYSVSELAGSQEFKKRFLPADFEGFLHDAEYVAVADQNWL